LQEAGVDEWNKRRARGEGCMNQVRTHLWLETALLAVWDRHFADVPVANTVRIGYCRPSKTRLGWIALSESGLSTHIGINRLLQHLEAPEEVCVITIAHELVHYGRGFGSPLPQRYDDPHAGGIVEHELHTRGLSHALAVYQDWSFHAWDGYYARYARSRARASGAYGAGTLMPRSMERDPHVAALDLK
jgi:hypothetical protein